MRVVLLLVDALKSEYLQPELMPSLHSLACSNFHVKRIIPGVGFCERNELFTGASPAISGNFTAIGFDPSRSEYRGFAPVAGFISAIGLLSRRAARYSLRTYCKITKKHMKPYLIPPPSLRNYTLTEDGNYQYNGVDESLLTALGKAGKSFSLEAFTSLGTGKRPVPPAKFADFILNNGDAEFIPLYYGDIDSYGHMLGDDLGGMAPHLAEADKLISQIYDLCLKADSDTAFVVLGDHGMVPVKRTVDIKGRLGETGLKLGRDYEMFLDSTIARFWCKNSDTTSRIIGALEKIPLDLGRILNEEESVALGVPMNVRGGRGERLYGDVLWYAESGTLISPDYFNPADKALRGMHGYLRMPQRDGFGLLVAAWPGCNNKSLSAAGLVDVCPTLCRLMGLEYPKYCEGVSLL